MQRQPERELMDRPEEARAYASASFPEIMDSVVDRLLDLAGDAQNARMVDLGTGPGSIPLTIAKARPSWRITAVEAAKPMFRIAQISIKMAGLDKRVSLQLADAKATGLRAASFDVVFCNNLLHHMPDPLPLWREIRRLAAPGGLLFVRDLLRPASEQAARDLIDQNGADQPNRQEFYNSLLSAFRIDEVREQLNVVGLSALRVEAIPAWHLDVYGRLPE